MSQLDILLIALRVAFGALVPLCFIAVLVWMERRGCAFIQDRSGPNRCNIFGFRAAGLVQNLADAVKLVTKEDVIPTHIRHKFYFVLAPVLIFTVSLVSFAVVPFADTLVIDGKQYLMQAIPTDLGILWFLAIVGFSVYGIILGGWSSHNKYGILGGLRSAAQVISYEIPLAMALISLLVVYGTVNLTEIAQFQGKLLFGFIPMWGVVLQPLGAIIFITAAFAEVNRVPFDLAEGESEIVAGFHVEYSGMKFGMFFMGEYVAMFTSSAIIVTLFFGGFQIPWLATETLVNNSRWFLSCSWCYCRFSLCYSLVGCAGITAVTTRVRTTHVCARQTSTSKSCGVWSLFLSWFFFSFCSAVPAVPLRRFWLSVCRSSPS